MPLFTCRRFVLRVALGVFAVSASGGAVWAADAGELIQNVAKEVIELIKAKAGPERQAGIKNVLETSFDLAFMGRSALATHWNSADEEQRTRFLKAAATAEARAYSERFGQYAGQTLVVGRVTNRANGVTIVDSRLNQASGEPIKIEWEVRDTGQGLRITDVKIEGVSMVFTRRSDFNSYIQSHGGKVEPLIEELEARAKR